MNRIEKKSDYALIIGLMVLVLVFYCEDVFIRVLNLGELVIWVVTLGLLFRYKNHYLFILSANLLINLIAIFLFGFPYYGFSVQNIWNNLPSILISFLLVTGVALIVQLLRQIRPIYVFGMSLLTFTLVYLLSFLRILNYYGWYVTNWLQIIFCILGSFLTTGLYLLLSRQPKAVQKVTYYQMEDGEVQPVYSSRQPVHKMTYFILALCFGGIGAHKFYEGKTGLGVLYLCTCWLLIPSIVAFIEGLMVLGRPTDQYGNLIYFEEEDNQG